MEHTIMGPPVPSDYPEFDPILVKCISYLQVGGKESRKHLKELINDLVKGDEKPDTPQTSRGSSPNVIAQPGKVGFISIDRQDTTNIICKNILIRGHDGHIHIFSIRLSV